MKYLIALLALSNSPLCASEEMLKWYPNPARFPEGECVRLNAPSGGDSYVEKVRAEECRPSVVSYFFNGEFCFEVDRESQGKGYGMKLKSPEKCAPPDSLYSFDPIKQFCYLVDPSGGLKFKAKIETKECRPKEEEIKPQFVFDREKLMGECFEVHRTLGESRWKRRIEIMKCRPERTYYSWRPLSQFKGDCFEVSSAGAEDFFAKTIPQKCKTSETIYQFERKSEKAGDCFELDAETQGQKYSLKVAASFCR